MRILLLLIVVVLTGCMQTSDLVKEARYHMGDVGLLNHHQVERPLNMRLEHDALIYIVQSHFPPVGHEPEDVEPNILAKESFKAFVEYFPRVRRSDVPLGLDEALVAARAEQADYLMYVRLAHARDRMAVDSAVVQLMLYEMSALQRVDNARIPIRSGVLTSWNNRPEDFLVRPMQDYARRLQGLSR